jgi:hypothetical protein
LKCFFHVTEDALYECSLCGKPICAQCMRFDEEDQVVCPACTLEKAVDIADEDVHRYMTERHRQIEQRRKKKAGLAQKLDVVNGWLVLVIVLLIAGQVALRYYIGRAGEPAAFDDQRFQQLGDPGIEMSYILGKVFQYANDHGGQMPADVKALTPDYLESPPTVLGSEEMYIFTPINGPERFVFSLPKADRFGYRRLYATGDGVLKVE